MNRNAILNAMEKKARVIFENNSEYMADGKRGYILVQIRDAKNELQWDSSHRSFGATHRDYGYEGELVINNGVNFDALAHAKAAFSRRTGKDSGTNYYQVLGNESWWRGSIVSDDGACVCAFAGFTSDDDALIARAGITCYESLKRTGRSLDAKGDSAYEDPDSERKNSDGDTEEDKE